MLTSREAYRRVMKNDPMFRIEGAVDYDPKYYIFAGGLEMWAVDKRTGSIVGFNPTIEPKKYFAAVKKRPIDINTLK